MKRLSLAPALSAKLLDSGLEVVVTGASGWLGQATLEVLESCLGPALQARVHAFASVAKSMTLRSGTQIDVHPLTDLRRWGGAPHLLTHYAFVTREYVTAVGITGYVARNEAITSVVADHVARHQPVGMAFLSSGAVYLGDDLATNPYGVLKARDERTFFDLAGRHRDRGPGLRLVVPRLFNLSGPFLHKPDDLVLGSIIRDIDSGGPIRLKATHPVVRSYIAVGDLIELAWASLLDERPLPLEGFDTAGEREVEVGELAELASSVLGHTGMPIERPPLESPSSDRYVGDPTTMRSLMARYGIVMQHLPSQIADTAEFMRG